MKQIEALRARRQSTARPPTGVTTACDARLIGLAFSGGGIRSATFNLGVLQGLAKHNLLPVFDYLSTVSGGGYIGSWFYSWIKRREKESAGSGLRTVIKWLIPDRVKHQEPRRGRRASLPAKLQQLPDTAQRPLQRRYLDVDYHLSAQPDFESYGAGACSGGAAAAGGNSVGLDINRRPRAILTLKNADLFNEVHTKLTALRQEQHAVVVDEIACQHHTRLEFGGP